MKLTTYAILFSSLLLSASQQSFAAKQNPVSHDRPHGDEHLFLSIPIQPDTLDPRLSVNAHTKFTLPLLFEPLVTISAQQTLQPVLAKSWKISSNNKQVTITLKQGHHFSDRSEVTAIDVKNSIVRLCSPGSQEYGELRGLVGCIAHAKDSKTKPGIDILDKYTIRFNITSSPTTFLYELSSPSAVIVKTVKMKLIGSGPYLLKQQSKIKIVLDKSSTYYGETIVNNNGITLFYASGKNVIDALNNNKADGALMYRLEELADFNNFHYKMIKSNPNITEILVLNNQRFPFDQGIVRNALAVEMYNSFNYACISGAHKPYGIIPSGIGGSINNLAPKTLTPISPEQVFKSVPRLRSKTSQVTIHKLKDMKNDCESTQIIEAAKKFNINITFQYHNDYSDLLPKYLNHDLDGFIDLYVFKNREAYKIFEFFAKSGENDANVQNDEIDFYLKDAIAMPSSHGRFQLYRKLAQHIQDNNIVIPLFYMDHGNWLNKCLTGISEDFFFNPFLHLPQISKRKNCNIS